MTSSATLPADRPVRWGIVATGGIAAQMARDLRDTDDAELVAVASRSQERADAFAAEHGVPRAHGDYRALLEDDEVDVLYVATPHRQHHAVALAALEAGTPMLVEKAFTMTEAGAREVLDAANARGVFVMEGMWSRFLPLLAHVREVVRDGRIGEVRSVSADLGLIRPQAEWDRLWDPEQGGGALHDLGVYPISFVDWFLGAPESITTTGVVGPTGVETDAAALLTYASGAHAVVQCSMVSPLAGAASIVGTAGRIDVAPRLHHPSRAVLHREGEEPQTLTADGDLAMTGHGFVHEVLEVGRCLREGLTESPVMPWSDSLAVMQVLTRMRADLGVETHEADAASVGLA